MNKIIINLITQLFLVGLHNLQIITMTVVYVTYIMILACELTIPFTVVGFIFMITLNKEVVQEMNGDRFGSAILLLRILVKENNLSQSQLLEQGKRKIKKLVRILTIEVMALILGIYLLRYLVIIM